MILLAAGCAHRAPMADPPAPAQPPESPAQRKQHITSSIERGVAFLLKSQNPDGSWGTGLVTRGFEIVAQVPDSLHSFRVATTSLCVMALREAGEKTAHDRGVEYLVTHGQVFRDSTDLVYNTWAHIYAAQALAIEMRSNPDPRIRKMVEFHVDRLARYETFEGGWNYYDFDIQAEHPGMGGTSFGTAAGLVALWEARKSGCEVPQPLVDRAMRVLKECRMPNDACLYGVEYRYVPRLDANQTRGSFGRAQPTNFAMWLWNSPLVGEKQAAQGLGVFEKEHIFIDMGRQRQFPHEAWYQTAPYYYYFDHYYAARILEKLSGEARQQHAWKLADFILPKQEADGSWWDYAMWDFHKPYGTAYAVMTLLRCREH
jgi:hypothetical protein